MPTYSYKCSECGHAFDIQQSILDDSLTTCPECGGELRKVFGAVGITFKGSGFYRTDSTSGRSQSVASGKSESKTEAGSTGGTTGGDSSSAAAPKTEKKSGSAAAASGSSSTTSSAA